MLGQDENKDIYIERTYVEWILENTWSYLRVL